MGTASVGSAPGPAGTPPWATGVRHIPLRCTDLAASRRFYTEVLGFPIVLEDANLVLLLVGDTSIGLRCGQAGACECAHALWLAGAGRAGLVQLADALSAAGHAHGGVLVSEPASLILRDPDGVAWAVYAP